MIPSRKTDIKPEQKRFYVHSNTLVHLELQKEAYRRGLNAWDLGGLVIQQWIEAGFPNLAPVEPKTPCPSPSSSVAESFSGGKQ
jgi:hypothetical protein